MVDIIPPFFTKRDFWAMLLPGYTLIILGLLISSPNLLINSGGGLSPDLFSIVVFIVGGPVAGFILLQFYYYISAYSSKHGHGSRRKFEFRRNYELLKLNCTEEEKIKLEEFEGRHFFGECTGIALGIIGLYAIALFVSPYVPEIKTICSLDRSLFCDQGFFIRNLILLVIIFGLAIILYSGAYEEYHRVQLPLICELIGKHCPNWPDVCEESKKKGYEEKIDETFLRFKNDKDECFRHLDEIKLDITFDWKIKRLGQSYYDDLDDKISDKKRKFR